jgi:hypothetical protein
VRKPKLRATVELFSTTIVSRTRVSVSDAPESTTSWVTCQFGSTYVARNPPGIAVSAAAAGARCMLRGMKGSIAVLTVSSAFAHTSPAVTSRKVRYDVPIG